MRLLASPALPLTSPSTAPTTAGTDQTGSRGSAPPGSYSDYFGAHLMKKLNLTVGYLPLIKELWLCNEIDFNYGLK